MILSEVRDYLRRHGEVSLRDLALHFDTDPEALRGMLEHWMRKGKVSRRGVRAACGNGGCTQCDPASVEIYAWGDNPMADGRALIRDLGCEHH